MLYIYVGPLNPSVPQALYNVSHLPTHTMRGAIMPLGAIWGSVFCPRHQGIKPPTLKFVDNLLDHLSHSHSLGFFGVRPCSHHLQTQSVAASGLGMTAILNV